MKEEKSGCVTPAIITLTMEPTKSNIMVYVPTVDALPRLRSESHVMRVNLKRRFCSKSHQLFQMKQIHPHYEDVTIRDDKLCDPILTEEEDNDDDDLDENMDNADYDKDLMETDMYKESALCEAEDDPENDQDIVMQPCYNQQPEEP